MPDPTPSDIRAKLRMIRTLKPGETEAYAEVARKRGWWPGEAAAWHRRVEELSKGGRHA